jgi:hypothetical protein
VAESCRDVQSVLGELSGPVTPTCSGSRAAAVDAGGVPVVSLVVDEGAGSVVVGVPVGGAVVVGSLVIGSLVDGSLVDGSLVDGSLVDVLVGGGAVVVWLVVGVPVGDVVVDPLVVGVPVGDVVVDPLVVGEVGGSVVVEVPVGADVVGALLVGAGLLVVGSGARGLVDVDGLAVCVAGGIGTSPSSTVCTTVPLSSRTRWGAA